MAEKEATVKEPRTLHVYAVADPEGLRYVTLPPEGADLPAGEAKALIEQGLATTKKPEEEA